MTAHPLSAFLILFTVPVALSAQCETAALYAYDFGAGSLPEANHQFGSSVDVFDDVLVVGEPFTNGSSGAYDGAAYVYRFDGVSFQPEQKLEAAPGLTGQLFGYEVFCAQDSILVRSGPAFEEFAFDGVAWTQSPTPQVGVGAVAYEGDRIVVGESFLSAVGGEAHIYHRDPTGWVLEQSLQNPLPGVTGDFGRQVASGGGLVAVTATYFGLLGGPVQGVVHLYRLTANGWRHEALLSASDAGPLDDFGGELALSGDTLAVSARGAELAGYDNSGAVYVYRDQGGGVWLEEQKLVSEVPSGFNEFGRSLDLDGDLLVAGSNASFGFPSAANFDVFHRAGGSWQRVPQALPSGFSVGGDHQPDVAVWGHRVALGQPYQDWFFVENAGSAHVFSQFLGTDLGSALDGTGGVAPTLEVDAASCATGGVQVDVADVVPFGPSFLVLGFSQAELSLLGGVLVPWPDLWIPFSASGTGQASLAFSWPATLAGIPSWWQVAVVDSGAVQGVALSNAVGVDATF